MSRSYRKISKAYTASLSGGEMKSFKRMANKLFRRKVKRMLTQELEGKDVAYPKKIQEGWDLWCSSADGNQHWFGNLKYDKKYRKYYEKRMRK